MLKQCTRSALVLLVCAVLIGCSHRQSSSPPPTHKVVLPDSPWPSFRGNAGNTGQGMGSGTEGRLKWTFSAPESRDCTCSTPAIGEDGTVYVTIRGRDDYLYALDSSGKEKWKVDIARHKLGRHRHVASELWFDVSSPAIGAGNLIYVGSDDHHLYAINATDGKEAWTFDSGAAILSSPNVGPDGTVHFGSQNRRVYALDGVTGKSKWTRKGAVAYTPAIGDDGIAYFGVGQSLEARNSSGITVWSSRIGSCTDWAVGSDRAYIKGSLGDGNVAAADLKTGHRLWSFTTGIHPSELAVSRDGSVYVGDAGGRQGKLYALDGKTGQPLWQFDHYSGNHAPTLDAEGNVYIVVPPKVLALDGKTGKVKWRLDLSLGTDISPLAIDHDGTVYVGTGEGKLHAIE